MNKRLGKNRPCPCDSGKKYKNCCYKKDFEYCVDEKGEIYRSVKLPKEFAEEFKLFAERQKEEFKKIFEREMEDDDPLFFQQRYQSNELEMYDMMLDMLKEMGAKPEQIFAFIKTGIIVTTRNFNVISEKDIKMWECAVDEYRERVKRGENPLEDIKGPKEILEMIEEFEKSSFIIAQLLSEDNFSLDETYIDKKLFCDSVIFCLNKIEKNIKSIQSLLGRTDTIGDSLSISRSIYEVYLSLQFLIKYPDQAEKIFNPTKKNHYKIQYMAYNGKYPEDAKIHDILYPFLSSYSHANLGSSFSYSDTEKSAPLIFLETCEITLTYSLFSLFEILKISELKERAKVDLIKFIKKSKKRILNFYSGFLNSPHKKGYVDLIIKRIEELDIEKF